MTIREPERGILVDEINYDAEWAYYIDIKTLRLKRVQMRVPIGSVVLTKERGVTEEGIKYVETRYGIADSSGVKSLPKKEVSKILVKQALEYMKSNKRWPPGMTLKDKYRNEDAEVIYAPSEYDSFNLKFTESLVGKKPIEFLEVLGPSEKNPELVWKVETAKSGRAKCNTCDKVIEEGRFRIGEPYIYERHLSYHWHHPKCIASVIYTPVEKMDGFRFLKPEEKLRLKKLLQK
jgi:hypothetical protein